MALIVCKKCGKNISDKSEKCIHCGQPLNETEPVTERVSNNEKAIANMHKFSTLSNVEKRMLELEFIKTDKWAYVYRRCGVEIPKLGKFALAMPVFLAAGVAAVTIVAESVNNGFVLTPWLEKASFVFYALSASMMAVAILLLIYNRIQYGNAINRMTYHKKMQAWLRDVKKINYQPSFRTEREKCLFDEIEID